MVKKILSLVIAFTLIGGSYTAFADIELSAKTKAQKHEDLKLKQNQLDSKETSVTALRFMSEKEKRLLARLVHAEAKGEPFEGKVAVAAVVLNRVNHKKFPNTIKGVIYQRNAFQPVMNGSINKPADQQAIKAVETAVTNRNKYEGLLFFYNPKTATSNWIFTRKVEKKIGKHAFAK